MKWLEKSYRRNLVDIHIEDWNPAFLSKLDPAVYVENLKTAQVKSAMIYANSHVGLCNWPTKTGAMHKGLNDRDFLGDVLALCAENGIDTVVYYSLVYNNWTYEKFPTWRIRNVDGQASRDPDVKNFFMKGRYGVCCSNNKEYREFTFAQLDELFDAYPFQGMFFDMTYWPAICFCDACKQRYAAETGGSIPEIIDWNDERWVNFQRKREEWMSEFVHTMTAKVKSRNPDVTVEHTCATIHFPYLLGTVTGNSDASDYAGGDFYGGFLQQSFICKLYSAVTQNQPFEYMTSRCYPSLKDHTTMKTKEMLELHAFLALAHNGAFLAIDAINPDGSLNKEVYQLLGSVFSELKKFEQNAGGTFCADAAIYFPLTSKYYPQDNGKHIRDAIEINDTSTNMPYLDAPLGAARTMREAHIPFAVIARPNLETLANYQLLIVPGARDMTLEEIAAFKAYVENGGTLYLSGETSPALLADVFGIKISGTTKETLTYIAPVNEGCTLFPHVAPEYPLTVFAAQLIAENVAPENVLAQIVLPGTDPADSSTFVSIHSNPPQKNSGAPAMIKKSFGQGRVIWSAAQFEAAIQPPHKKAFESLVRSCFTVPPAFSSNAHPAVELTLFEQPERARFLLNLVNAQDVLPPVPIHGIQLYVRLNGKTPESIVRVSDGVKLFFSTDGDTIQFMADLPGLFEMIAVNWK
ncbi:MAG: alpha-L-fucosidase [Kiritimatiellales bacterium]